MVSIIARCLVVLGYYSYRKNGTIMAGITATVTAITEMVRGRTETVPLGITVRNSNLNSVRHLINQLVAFASHFVTTK